MSAVEIAKALKKAYLPLQPIDIRSFNNLNNLFADGVIGIGVHRFVNYINDLDDVFYYKFSYIGRHSLFQYPHDLPYGVHHADDIQYLFDTPYVRKRGNKFLVTDPENIIVERMTRIWENFARTGLGKVNLTRSQSRM